MSDSETHNPFIPTQLSFSFLYTEHALWMAIPLLRVSQNSLWEYHTNEEKQPQINNEHFSFISDWNPLFYTRLQMIKWVFCIHEKWDD